MNSQAEALVTEAKKWVGYLEKKSNYQLEDYTANAGTGNYTVFGKWYPMQAQPWCASFVSYVAEKAGIPTSIIPKHASCTVGVNWFKQHGRWRSRQGYTPQIGDIIYFSYNGTSPAHVGIVYNVDASKVYTIEGNTSGGSTLIDNGGGVARKSYPLTYIKILGYGNPAYTDDTTEYKAIIQKNVGYSDPAEFFAHIDKFKYAKEAYRKWAESYK